MAVLGARLLGDQTLQPHARREQLLDHVIVQVRGDAFVIGHEQDSVAVGPGLVQGYGDAGVAGEPCQLGQVVIDEHNAAGVAPHQ